MVLGIKITRWQTRDPERLAWQLSELEKRIYQIANSSSDEECCELTDFLIQIPGIAARGDLLFYGAAGWELLPAGSIVGQVLATGGPGADPGWLARVTGDNGDLTLLDSASPVTQAAGTKLISVASAGRSVPAMVDIRGELTRLQQNLHARSWCQMRAVSGGTTPSLIGVTGSVIGTAVTRTRAATNVLTRTARMAYATGVVAGTVAEWRSGAGQVTTGSGTVGGFYFGGVFAFSDGAAVAGVRGFCGVTVPGAATNVEPSTLVNAIGLAQLSTDTTQTYLVYGGSAAQTPIALGTDFAPFNGAPTVTSGNLFHLELWSPRTQNGVVYYQVSNLSNGAVTRGTLSGTPGTTTPSSTTLMSFKIWRCNNATALDAAFDMSELVLLDEPPL